MPYFEINSAVVSCFEYYKERKYKTQVFIDNRFKANYLNNFSKKYQPSMKIDKAESQFTNCENRTYKVINIE